MAKPQKPRFVPPKLFTVGADELTPTQVLRFNFWIRLLQTRPFLILGGAWMLTATAGLIAMLGLMSPGELRTQPPSPPQEETTLTQETPSTVAQPTVAPIPLWTLGALVGSCALGSIILSKVLSRPPVQPQKALASRTAIAKQLPGQAPSGTRRLNPARSPRVIQKSQPKRLKKLKPYREPGVRLLPPIPSPLQQAQPQPQRPTAFTIPAPPPAPSRSAKPSRPIKPAVTVVPPEETHPLDWGEESLAHMVDLRKQRPLSSLL